MATKTATLQYGVDDTPTLGVTLLSALQHVGLMAIYLVVPLLMAREAGASAEVTQSVLGLSMVALGIGMLLQAWPKVGSGYLAPPVFTGVYVGPSLQAIHLGGLPMLAGMTIFAGLVESATSRILRRLRPFMPPELAGLVIFLTGTTNGAVGLKYLLGAGADPPGGREWLVTLATLAPMLGLSVWTKGKLRLVCALVGMAAGCAVALATGALPVERLGHVADGHLVALPSVRHLSWSFSPLLIVPFCVGALACTLKAVGVISVSQRMNDTEWLRPQMGSITRGVFADGLGTSASGILGTVGVNVAPSCTGLVAATGVASRRVGYAIGMALIALAFLPVVPRMFSLLPRPVVGAVLVFTACFILLNGIETIASRMLDTRKILVIGFAIIAALAADVFPDLIKSVPAAAKPLVETSLVFGTLVGIVLNLIFRLGVRKRVVLTIDPAEYDARVVRDFMEQTGAAWGARREIIRRAAFSIDQFVETVLDAPEPPGPLTIAVSFDEFNLDVQARYRGEPLELPERRPTEREILEAEEGHRRLAGFLLRRNADSASSTRSGHESIVTFHFEH
jgi:NCS2 family nucleobase:cation symporter-2